MILEILLPAKSSITKIIPNIHEICGLRQTHNAKVIARKLISYSFIITIVITISFLHSSNYTLVNSFSLTINHCELIILNKTVSLTKLPCTILCFLKTPSFTAPNFVTALIECWFLESI